MAVKCPRCGEENPEDKRYCGDCGFPLNLGSGSAIETRIEPETPDYLPPSTWWGWLNQRYWHAMGLPKRGLSRAGFLLYLAFIFLVTFVILVALRGPFPAILALFLIIVAGAHGAIMYWVYSSNDAFKRP